MSRVFSLRKFLFTAYLLLFIICFLTANIRNVMYYWEPKPTTTFVAAGMIHDGWADRIIVREEDVIITLRRNVRYSFKKPDDIEARLLELGASKKQLDKMVWIYDTDGTYISKGHMQIGTVFSIVMSIPLIGGLLYLAFSRYYSNILRGNTV